MVCRGDRRGWRCVSNLRVRPLFDVTAYAWRYVDTGTCADCDSDRARLYAPELPGTRATLAARVCSTCRARYDLGQIPGHRCPRCLLSLRPGPEGYRCAVCRRR